MIRALAFYVFASLFLAAMRVLGALLHASRWVCDALARSRFYREAVRNKPRVEMPAPDRDRGRQ